MILMIHFHMITKCNCSVNPYLGCVVVIVKMVKILHKIFMIYIRSCIIFQAYKVEHCYMNKLKGGPPHTDEGLKSACFQLRIIYHLIPLSLEGLFKKQFDRISYSLVFVFFYHVNLSRLMKTILQLFKQFEFQVLIP